MATGVLSGSASIIANQQAAAISADATDRGDHSNGISSASATNQCHSKQHAFIRVVRSSDHIPTSSETAPSSEQRGSHQGG